MGTLGAGEVVGEEAEPDVPEGFVVDREPSRCLSSSSLLGEGVTGTFVCASL